jgi:hypothetical protein
VKTPRSLPLAGALCLLALASAPARAQVVAVWANDGGDKVLKEERRAVGNPSQVLSKVWDGNQVKLFGARNEVLGFSVQLEAGDDPGAPQVSVSMSALTGPNGAKISSVPATGDGVFDWTQRNVELFYVRYLQVHGLSTISYEDYDERHVPSKMRRPWTGDGVGVGGWADRPGADKSFPDIMVPLELVPQFDIAADQTQSVWVDIFIPVGTPVGAYTATLTVSEQGVVTHKIPVQLTVRSFTLPAEPTSKAAADLGYQDINERYTGKTDPKAGSDNEALSRLVRDRHFQLAHRHKIALIDSNLGSEAWDSDSPRPEWLPRLDGTLFSPQYGYSGPGVFTGNGLYSIGTYGTWGWKGDDDEQSMWTHADKWESWFEKYSPDTERFLYLVDESTDYPQTERWAKWLKDDPGLGGKLPSFATLSLPDALTSVPDLTISCSWATIGDPAVWQPAANKVLATYGAKQMYAYNGKRPSSGSFATEDDGVALRELPWGQYKKGMYRWYFWESTYYNSYQDGQGETNLFETAQTMGAQGKIDPKHPEYGLTGHDYANGDGVLFYPGTDKLFPQDSYGVNGPFASLRLKMWRRGIQDVDYIALASKVDSARVQRIVNRMVPKALWDYGVADTKDPTWMKTDISWSINPDDWEAARAELADIIESAR